MKKLKPGLFAVLWLGLAVSFQLKATDEKPCFVFSGASSSQNNFDLEKYNRITFKDNAFILSSSKDEQVSDMELLYDLFNHLEFKGGVPSEETGVGLTENKDWNLQYDADTREIILISDNSEEYVLGIFDLGGNLLISSRLVSNTGFRIENLSNGIYIAIAAQGDKQQTLKFIVK